MFILFCLFFFLFFFACVCFFGVFEKEGAGGGDSEVTAVIAGLQKDT